MNFKTPANSFSYMLFNPTFTQGDLDLENGIIEKYTQLLNDPYFLYKWPTAYMLWDIIYYCDLESSLWVMSDECFFHRFTGMIQNFTEIRQSYPSLPIKEGTIMDAFINCEINCLVFSNHLYSNLKNSGPAGIDLATQLENVIVNL